VCMACMQATQHGCASQQACRRTCKHARVGIRRTGPHEDALRYLHAASSCRLGIRRQALPLLSKHRLALHPHQAPALHLTRIARCDLAQHCAALGYLRQ